MRPAQRAVASWLIRRLASAIALMDLATAGSASGVVEARGSVAGGRVLVYVHFSRDGRPRARDRDRLAEARSAGIAVCAVVNLRKRVDTAVDRIVPEWDPIADLVLVRRNLGRDLGGYRDAIRYLAAAGFRGAVAVANDSIYWEPGAFSRLFDASIAAGADVVGATSSLEVTPHLGSFWLLMREVPPSDKATRLTAGWRNYRTRGALVRFGELPFKRRAERLGLSTGALIGYPDVAERLRLNAKDSTSSEATTRRRLGVIEALDRGEHPNPTHFMWSELLELGFPGVKVDLATWDPAGIPDQAEVARVAADYGITVADEQPAPEPMSLRRRIRYRLEL